MSLSSKTKLFFQINHQYFSIFISIIIIIIIVFIIIIIVKKDKMNLRDTIAIYFTVLHQKRALYQFFNICLLFKNFDLGLKCVGFLVDENRFQSPTRVDLYPIRTWNFRSKSTRSQKKIFLSNRNTTRTRSEGKLILTLLQLYDGRLQLQLTFKFNLFNINMHMHKI